VDAEKLEAVIMACYRIKVHARDLDKEICEVLTFLTNEQDAIGNAAITRALPYNIHTYINTKSS